MTFVLSAAPTELKRIGRARAGRLALASLAGTALSAPNGATAQALLTAPGQTETVSVASEDAGSGRTGDGEIVVTARRRNERLIDVPIAISAVGGQELAAKHLERLADLTVRVPNFSALQQNTRVSGLFIRGLGGNASNDGAEGGVGLIVDNVFFTHVGFSWLDFVDLDSIEIVRGPQGTLLGKNTTVGAVIVQTQKPSFTPSASIAGTYGNYGLWQTRSNVTGPLTDKLAARLTVANTSGGGWITNAVDGAKYLDSNRWSVRGQLLWQPASGVSDRLIAEHYDTYEYNNFYPVAGDILSNLRLDGSVLSARTASWTQKVTQNLKLTPNYNAPYNANFDTQGRLRSRVDGVSNELNVDLGGPTLTSISAWRRLYFRPYNDNDFTPLPVFRNGFDVDVNQYSEEVRIASRSGKPIDWTIGGYYLHEDLESRLRTIYFPYASAFFLGPTAASATLNGLEVDRDGKLKVDSIAGFGQATWHATDRLSLTSGVRYTSEKKSATVVGSSFGGSSPPAAVATPAYSIAASVTHGSWSWLVNPAWRVNDNVNVYASASYGEKSGAVNTAATAAQSAVLIVQPEKSTDFEAGVKTSFAGGRATANLNLYNNTISNYQDTQVDQSQPLLAGYLANVGKVRLRGVELETAAQLGRGFSLFANGAYNDARYLSYANAPAPLEYQAYLATVQGVAAGITTLSLTGYQLRNAPRWTLQGGIDADHPVSSRIALTGYWNVAYRSGTNLVNPRSAFYRQPSYALVNAGIGARTTDGRWSALVWSKNLFNKLYAVAYSTASATTPIQEVFGDPRRYGLTVTRKF
ncbi:TonB-dependent receptor [Sphingomonas bacterium]|uniref:TonB-dependent receptor n=1 Tax=Sphingomonas bacterium TaxID=1895847 RepID=UPI0015753633|nr:TonB-dependent receptor [Sphingomonas bacterium]